MDSSTVLTWCGTLALEGGPIFWVATHRIHHQNSDREGDPHTPREGTWWAHMGWIVSGEGLHHDASVLARYAPDLVRDPVHVALSKWHWTSNVIVGLALLAYGGLPYVLWGIFFRTTVGLHATWLVNSATHKWGARRFETRDDSTNNWWVALLTFGEGWHNNHHAHPTSARHGLAWYETRSQLDRNPHAPGARPGLGHQAGTPQADGSRRRTRPAGDRRGRRLTKGRRLSKSLSPRSPLRTQRSLGNPILIPLRSLRALR